MGRRWNFAAYALRSARSYEGRRKIMRSKKIISMLAALSLAVSCFVGFASGVSAAQQDIWSSDFETDTKSPFAQYNEPDDTPTRIGQDTIVDGIGSNTSKVYNYQSASNCQNGTHGAIVTKTFDKTITNASFDFYILNDTSAAAQKSGSQQIATIALGNYNQYASSIAAANYNKGNL